MLRDAFNGIYRLHYDATAQKQIKYKTYVSDISCLKINKIMTIYRLFRAQRWHVQFWVICTCWCQAISINQAFLVQENFQLFSAVLVENRQTHNDDMFSFVQDLARNGGKKHGGDSTFVLCKFLDFQSTKVT